MDSLYPTMFDTRLSFASNRVLNAQLPDACSVAVGSLEELPLVQAYATSAAHCMLYSVEQESDVRFPLCHIQV